MLSIILTRTTASIYSYILIDSGGSAISFIDTDFAILYCLSIKRLESPLILNIIDSYIIVSSSLIYYIKISIRISYYIKQYIFLFTKLGHYPVVLDIKWL